MWAALISNLAWTWWQMFLFCNWSVCSQAGTYRYTNRC